VGRERLHLLRNQRFADSPPEGTGFEPSVLPKEMAVERGPAANHRRVARRPVLNDPIQLIGPASPFGNSRETFPKSGTNGSNPRPSSKESAANSVQAQASALGEITRVRPLTGHPVSSGRLANGRFSIAAGVKFRPDDFMLSPFNASATGTPRGSCFSSRLALGHLMMG